MKRLTALLLAALPLVAGPAVAKELKLADFQPPTHFVVDKVYKPFQTAVSDGTSGAVTVTLYMGGELGPGPKEQYNRALDGVTDIAFGLPGYTASAFQKTLLTELPGVITPETGTQAILANIDMLKKEYRRVQLVGIWNNTPGVLMMAKKPVHTMADLKGLNIRVPSRNAGLVAEAWGANPVSMPAPEIYNAMQTGVIDGALIDASALSGFKLKEVANYITTGMETTISTFFLVMNRDSFDSLTPDQQKVLLDAGKQASLDGQAAWAEVTARDLADFGKTEGKEMIALTPEEAATFNAASAEVVKKVVAEADKEGLEATAFIDALQKSK